MLPCVVTEISPLYAFCDVVGIGVGVGVVGGIGDSRSWIWLKVQFNHRLVLYYNLERFSLS